MPIKETALQHWNCVTVPLKACNQLQVSYHIWKKNLLRSQMWLGSKSHFEGGQGDTSSANEGTQWRRINKWHHTNCVIHIKKRNPEKTQEWKEKGQESEEGDKKMCLRNRNINQTYHSLQAFFYIWTILNLFMWYVNSYPSIHYLNSLSCSIYLNILLVRPCCHNCVYIFPPFPV